MSHLLPYRQSYKEVAAEVSENRHSDVGACFALPPIVQRGAERGVEHDDALARRQAIDGEFDRGDRALQVVGEASRTSGVANCLGGIYALEGVMNNSAQYLQPVLEALCAFVRTAPRIRAKKSRPATNSQRPTFKLCSR